MLDYLVIMIFYNSITTIILILFAILCVSSCVLLSFTKNISRGKYERSMDGEIRFLIMSGNNDYTSAANKKTISSYNYGCEKLGS